jgi:hypothetical protein
MLNHPDMEDQAPVPGKLVLPALPNTPGGHDAHSAPSVLQTSRPSAGQFDAQHPQVSPAQLIRPVSSAAPAGLLPKLAYYWRKDPAYKVFMLALVMVLVASIIFLSMASAALLGKLSSGSAYSQNPPTAVVSTGTVDLRPSFPAPGGGKGSDQSSQPPAQSTPVLNSTPSGDNSPTPQPTQPDQNGNLNVQITAYSRLVANGSSAYAVVSTGEPGVTVTLYIQSNATPRSRTAGPRTSDGNGNATISWQVFYSHAHRTVTLTVVAIGVDQDGHQSTSAPVTIEVLLQALP